MAAITLKLIQAGPHEVGDLGITINGAANALYDLVNQESQDVSMSTDLQALVTGGAIAVLDPRDPAEILTLNATESASVLKNHNQIHWGVLGGRFDELDDPNTVFTDGFMPSFDDTTGKFVAIDPAEVITANPEAVQDIVGGLVSGSPDFVYDDANETLVLADNFLKNTGDILDSGTLSVASGAAININTGGSLTIQDAPTANKDAVNKEYVDAAVTGLDFKESVDAATTTDLGFTQAGAGAGATLTAGAVGATVVDGVTLSDGDRVLVKDQTTASENGIYIVSGADAGSSTVLTRAEDQDGVGGDASSGNFVFVEGGGTKNGATGWVVVSDVATVDTDAIDWVQQSGQGAYSATSGVVLTGTEFSLDASTLPDGIIESTDELVFHDVSDGLSKKGTLADLLNNLDVVSGITTNGFLVRTADDTYTSRTFAVNGAGALGGLAVTDPAGIAGNPTFGLDIKSLTSIAGDVATNDRVAVYDASADTNVYYTISEIAGALAETNSFTTWTVDGVAGIEADNSTDTVDLASTKGITLTPDAANDRITFSLSNKGLVDTPIVEADTIAFFDGSDSNTPATRSFADILTDLNIPNNVTATGFVVRDAAGDYVSRSVVASTVAGREGIDVQQGDGSAGDPTVGLSISGLVPAANNLQSGDVLPVFDGTINVQMTGAQVTAGVTESLGGLAVSTINGTPVLTLEDSTRADKRLSVDTVSAMWSQNNLSNNDWVKVGNSPDSESGFVAPLNCTVVMVTGHCENADGNTKNIVAYVNTPGTAGGTPAGGVTVGTLTGTNNATFQTTDANIDLVAGDRLRLRGEDPGSSGKIQDTVITVFIKWRA